MSKRQAVLGPPPIQERRSTRATCKQNHRQRGPGQEYVEVTTIELVRAPSRENTECETSLESKMYHPLEANGPVLSGTINHAIPTPQATGVQKRHGPRQQACRCPMSHAGRSHTISLFHATLILKIGFPIVGTLRKEAQRLGSSS